MGPYEKILPEELSDSQIRGVWNKALEAIKTNLPKDSASFNVMLAPLNPLSFSDGVFTVAAPNVFLQDMVNTRYSELLGKALTSLVGSPASLRLIVSPTTALNHEPPVESPGLLLPHDSSPAPYKKKYSFENFVVGDSNKFACHAATMVAESPGCNYNPLFIWGGTGLGKTHLLFAIQDYINRYGAPTDKVTYVQTASFIDEYIAHVYMKKNLRAFDHKYLNNKVILFDDIQALGSTEGTQNKFFDLFNVLYSNDSHIVLASDRPPGEISQLSDRIRSRFEGGLMLDIKPPDFETRVAILSMKARAENLEVPSDVLGFIASKVKDNIRSLEGSLTKVFAHAKLYGTGIDLASAQAALKNQIAEGDTTKAPSMDLIKNAISSYYGVPPELLVGKRRTRPVVHARQVAMYLCRDMTNVTLAAIGDSFGGRNHATVLHACRKVEAMIKEKKQILQEISELTARINKSL